MELGKPEHPPFVFSEKTGWKCPCGAEQTNRSGTFQNVKETNYWDHAVKVTIITCQRCGFEVRTSKAYDIIDVEVGDDPVKPCLSLVPNPSKTK